MAFPAVESVTGTQFSSTSGGPTYDVNLPATVLPGELLMVLFTSRLEANPDFVDPSGWTELYSDPSDVNATPYCIVKKADGTEDGGTVTVDRGGSAVGSAASALCYRISGWSEDITDVEASGKAESTNDSPDPGSLSPSWGAEDTLWLEGLHYGDDDGTLDALSTGFSNLQNQLCGAGTNNCGTTGAGERALNAASLDPDACTLSQTENWGAYTIAIRPAAGGVTVPYYSGLSLMGVGV